MTVDHAGHQRRVAKVLDAGIGWWWSGADFLDNAVFDAEDGVFDGRKMGGDNGAFRGDPSRHSTPKHDGFSFAEFGGRATHHTPLLRCEESAAETPQMQHVAALFSSEFLNWRVFTALLRCDMLLCVMMNRPPSFDACNLLKRNRSGLTYTNRCCRLMNDATNDASAVGIVFAGINPLCSARRFQYNMPSGLSG